MGHKWIIDVLDDLAAFAQQNDLPVLAEKLQETTAVALAETSVASEGAPKAAYVDGVGTRRLPGQGGAC